MDESVVVVRLGRLELPTKRGPKEARTKVAEFASRATNDQSGLDSLMALRTHLIGLDRLTLTFLSRKKNTQAAFREALNEVISNRYAEISTILKGAGERVDPYPRLPPLADAVNTPGTPARPTTQESPDRPTPVASVDAKTAMAASFGCPSKDLDLFLERALSAANDMTGLPELRLFNQVICDLMADTTHADASGRLKNLLEHGRDLLFDRSKTASRREAPQATADQADITTAAKATEAAAQRLIIDDADGCSIRPIQSRTLTKGGYWIHPNREVQTDPLSPVMSHLGGMARDLARVFVRFGHKTGPESERVAALLVGLTQHTLAFPHFTELLEKGMSWLESSEGKRAPGVLRNRIEAIEGGQQGYNSYHGDHAADLVILQKALATQSDAVTSYQTSFNEMVMAHSGPRLLLCELAALFICLHTPKLGYTLQEMCCAARSCASFQLLQEALRTHLHASPMATNLTLATITRCQERGFFPGVSDMIRSGALCTGVLSTRIDTSMLLTQPAAADPAGSDHQALLKNHRTEDRKTAGHVSGSKFDPSTVIHFIEIKGKKIDLPSGETMRNAVNAKGSFCVYCGSTEHRCPPEKRAAGCGNPPLPGYTVARPWAALWAKVMGKY